eukprot:2530472-Amphidinium_carterae.1
MTRLTGGFELRYEAGLYDVDWGHPRLKVGVLVFTSKRFAFPMHGDASEALCLLLAVDRLRVMQFLRMGWRLILLRSSVVEALVVEDKQDRNFCNA